VSIGANLELDLHIQLKDAENLKMTASQMPNSKSDWQKVKPKLKLPVGEEKTVPAEDGDFEYHHPFEAGKRHLLGCLLNQRTNCDKMAEVGRDLEEFLLNHVKHQFVDFVKVVTEMLNEGLNFEFVQDYQVHSVEKTLDSSQLGLQPILF
jgi:hypothetical protein